MAYADIQFEAPEAGLAKDCAAEELYRLGLMYSTGTSVSVDFVAAHKWFNLAAARGSCEAKVCRSEMAEMLNAAEIAKAQRAAREWMKQAN
jgi:TPR repeat protein